MSHLVFKSLKFNTVSFAYPAVLNTLLKYDVEFSVYKLKVTKLLRSDHLIGQAQQLTPAGIFWQLINPMLKRQADRSWILI